MSRIEAGKLELTIEQLIVSDVWESAERMLAAAAKAKKITLAGPENCSIRFQGDRRAVVQVLCNLVGNAIKFTESGGRIEVSAITNTGCDHLALTVSDSGIGIRPQLMPKLTDSLAQNNSYMTSSNGVAALGLAICSALIKGMKGEMEINSIEREGTQVTVRLPLKTGK